MCWIWNHIDLDLRLKWFVYLFRPSVGTILIGADIVESHFLLGTSSLCLEEDSFPVAAFGTRVVFGSGKCRIRNYVRNDVRKFAIK